MISLVLALSLVAITTGSLDHHLEMPSRFTPVTVDDGLSQGLVTDFAQDPSGFMWLGTYGGLNRYDGYQFRVFRALEGDPESISHNHVTCVRATPDGYVWIGTKTGLNRWDPKTETFKLYRHNPDIPESLPDNPILNLAVDNDGILWVGTQEGLARYNPGTDSFTVFQHDPEDPRSLSRNHVIWLYVTPEGDLWVGQANGLIQKADSEDAGTESTATRQPVVQRFNPDTNDFETFSIPGGQETFITQMGALPGGRLIFASRRGGIFEFDSGTGRIVPTTDPVLAAVEFVYVMFCASDGTIYIVNQDGMLQFNTLTGESVFHRHDPDNELSIAPSINITKIFEDDSGLIWIGYNGFGFATLSKTRYKFMSSKCEVLAGDRTNAQYVRCVEGDGSGGVWIISADNVLHHYRSDGEIQQHHRFENPIYALGSSGDERLWIGSVRGELFILEPGSNRPKLELNLGNRINSIKFDNQGQMVIFVEKEGFLKVENSDTGGYATSPYSTLISPEQFNEGNAFFDSRNRMWVSGEDTGVAMLESPDGPLHTFRFEIDNPGSLSNDSVSDFLESSDGTIWVATFGGLNRYLPENNSFRRITRANGLPEDLVFCLEEDDLGILWLGTSNGLVTYNPGSGESNIYTVADGLQSNEFNTRASCRLSNGHFVFGGVNGFNQFDPMQIPVNKYEPPIVMTELRVSGIQRKHDHENTLTLPNDDNFITFTFAALDYNNPRENQYAYLLEGLNEDWHYAGTQHSVSYHLAPGSYTLRAKAANSDGVWSEKELALKINILPAFWQTWWFNIGILLSLLAVVLVWHVLRNRSIQRRADLLDRLNRQLETQMEEISSLNVALNTFDYSVSNALRTPIRHIRFFNETLIEGIDSLPPEKIREYLVRTHEKADNLVDLIDALLTLSKAKRGDLRREEINLSGIAKKIISDLVADESTEVESSVQDGIKCRADLHLVTILLTNLISNAIRFSQETSSPKIEIGVQEKGRRVYYVRDNGIGISKERMDKIMEPFHAYHTDSSFEGIGLGLATCKLIVERHEGEIWIESQEDAGTTVYFSLND